jgi:predicted nuclease of predicted toxin-antitoxin system
MKLDENMPADLATLLIKGGHDVHGVVDESLTGSADSVIVQAARREERILMTFDTDFADIRRYPPGTHPGIVVFRLRDQRWATLAEPVNENETARFRI